MTIKQLTHVNVWVHDQDEALAFYTEKLGFEVRDDVTLPEMDGFRWLTVGPAGQEDVALTLMAIPGPPVEALQAERHSCLVGRRRELRPVRGGGDAVGAGEARDERAEALQPDREADVGNRAIRGEKQRGCALEPPRQQVLVRRLAERPAELAAEVRRREMRHPRERRDVERVAVTSVDQVLCAQQIAVRRMDDHRL